MNLYLISQSRNNNWDTYDSAVVAAWTAEQARHMHPDPQYKWNGDVWITAQGFVDTYSAWTDPKYVAVTHIGNSGHAQPEVILASFNAG